MSRAGRRNQDEQTVLIASALLRVTLALLLLIVGAALLEWRTGWDVPEPLAWSGLAGCGAVILVRLWRDDRRRGQ